MIQVIKRVITRKSIKTPIQIIFSQVLFLRKKKNRTTALVQAVALARLTRVQAVVRKVNPARLTLVQAVVPVHRKLQRSLVLKPTPQTGLHQQKLKAEEDN